jgi:protoporphyrinogen oxidase
MQQNTIGIVGGGIMGMVLAWRLKQQGNNVTIFEAAPHLGGLASSWKMDDVEWDKFYHVILMSDNYTRTILKEIGLDETIEWVETKTGFYMKGQLYSMSDTVEFLKFPGLNLIDKFRLGLTILIASRIKNWKRLEKIPVTTWLRKWSGKNTFNKIWLPLLKAKLGDTYTKTSAVFIWATIQRLYGARRSGLKKEMFGYVPGGYKTVVERFEKKLLEAGVSIKTNAIATEIKNHQNKGVQVSFIDGTSQQFQKVVSTLPSSLSAKICNGLTAAESTQLKAIEYMGVICVAVLLTKPVSNFYITNITDTWVPFTGVIEMSALVDKKNFNNYSLVYLPKYVISTDAMFEKTDDEIRNFFTENFLKMYPSFSAADIKFAGVAKAKHVITVLAQNYSENLLPVTTSIPGVYIVNTSHILDGTLNINETIRVAETKLKEIIA